MGNRGIGDHCSPRAATAQQRLVPVPPDGRGAADCGATRCIPRPSARGLLGLWLTVGDARAGKTATEAGDPVAEVGREAARWAAPIVTSRRPNAGGASCRRGCVTATRASAVGHAVHRWAATTLDLLDDCGGDGCNLVCIDPTPPASAVGHALGRVVIAEQTVGSRNPGQGAGRPTSPSLAPMPGRLSVAPRGGSSEEGRPEGHQERRPEGRTVDQVRALVAASASPGWASPPGARQASEGTGARTAAAHGNKNTPSNSRYCPQQA